MLSFPVSSSILAAAPLGSFLQQRYGFSENAHCTLLKAGVNHTYLLTDQDRKAIFRLYSFHWRTRSEIGEEIRLINLLKAGDIPVSYPLMDLSGDYIQELEAPEGPRLGVLFSFARGEKQLTFPADLHFKVGETMARMHQLTQQVSLDRVTYTPQVLLDDSFDEYRQFVADEWAEMDFLKSARTYLRQELETANSAAIRRGAVHLDIWFDNLSIDGDQFTIFDFDFCGNGWLCLDIAYYILQIHSTEADIADYYAKRERFLEGYESVMPISAEEKRLLPMLGVCIYLFYLGIQCQRYDNWSNVFINEVYLKRFISQRIKRWYDFNQLPAISRHA